MGKVFGRFRLKGGRAYYNEVEDANSKVEKQNNVRVN